MNIVVDSAITIALNVFSLLEMEYWLGYTPAFSQPKNTIIMHLLFPRNYSHPATIMIPLHTDFYHSVRGFLRASPVSRTSAI